MVDIIFLGYCVNKETAEKLSGISIAGNKMQLGVLRHMRQYVRNLDITTIYPVAAFPVDKKIIYRQAEIKLSDNIRAKRVSFLNIPLFKQISQILSHYKAVKGIARKNRNAIILTFNMYPQVGLPAVWTKKKYGNKIVTLLADLPIDDNYARHGIGKWIFRLFNVMTVKLLGQIDGAIVLNQKAWELYTPQARCLVMEGGYDDQGCNETEYTIENKAKLRKNIVYSGSLNEYSGIRELIEAMQYVNDMDIKLDIYGDGHLKEYVRSKCSDRIQYYGSIPNKEMMKVQQDAWALINPRAVDDPIAKVTFPSKIFEYLTSGSPVISTRLNGFLKEYEGLLIFAESNKPQEIARCINVMAEQPYNNMLDMAGKAKKFIIENKSWAVQVENMINFIEKEFGESR